MKFWAQMNLGNTGGYWFMQVCRWHPDVWAWAEAPTNPKYSPVLLPGETLIDYIEREREKGDIKSLGFVKSPNTVSSYCREHGGRVASFVRHPIVTVANKTRQYYDAVKRKGRLKVPWQHIERHIVDVEKRIGRAIESRNDHFEGFIKILADKHRGLIDRSTAYPLVRIEVFDRSLDTDRFYFRRVMEYLTQVAWTDSMAVHVRDNILPNPIGIEGRDPALPPHKWWDEHRWSYDPEPVQKWEAWGAFQRSVFLREFKGIMLQLGYGWPDA